MRAAIIVCVVWCGACGRVGFDVHDDSNGSQGGSGDASAVAGLLFRYALEDDPNVNGGADDSSGNGRLAPCLNPNPCPLLWDLDDFRGTSRICDFEDGTLIVPHDAALGGVASGFTLSLFAEVENGGGCLVAMPGSWKLCAVGTTSVVFTMLQSGTTTSAGLAAGWNHIAAVWTGSQGILYVGGGQNAQSGTITAPAAGAVIGTSDPSGTQERLDGWMDEIQLYGRVLGDAEILALSQD